MEHEKTHDTIKELSSSVRTRFEPTSFFVQRGEEECNSRWAYILLRFSIITLSEVCRIVLVLSHFPILGARFRESFWNIPTFLLYFNFVLNTFFFS